MNTLNPQFATTVVAPLSRERLRVEQFRLQYETKSAARDRLMELIQDERDAVQAIEMHLPRDCPYLGMSVADLAAVKIDNDRRRRVVHPDHDLTWQLGEARRAAAHRERAAEIKAQVSAVGAAAAALNGLIRNITQYLDKKEQRA